MKDTQHGLFTMKCIAGINKVCYSMKDTQHGLLAVKSMDSLTKKIPRVILALALAP